VWIVILHWRGPELTAACLKSLETLTYKNYKTLVVDNGSENNDGASLAKQFPWIEVLPLAENFGFAGGNNRGMETAIGEGADFIWLLNNDTTVSPSSLTTLVEAAQKFPGAGVLGAMVAEDLRGGKTVGGYGIIDFTHGKTKVTMPKTDSPTECQWMQGSNFLLSTQALKQVGLFDERYFLYFEDTDLCYRMTKSGWKCLLVPGALIAHIGNASTQDRRRHWRSYYYIRNRFLFFATYLNGMNKVVPQFFMLAHLARHTLALPFRGENGRCQLRAELLGARDYFAGNFGKAKCLDWCEPSKPQ